MVSVPLAASLQTHFQISKPIITLYSQTRLQSPIIWFLANGQCRTESTHQAETNLDYHLEHANRLHTLSSHLIQWVPIKPHMDHAPGHWPNNLKSWNTIKIQRNTSHPVTNSHASLMLKASAQYYGVLTLTSESLCNLLSSHGLKGKSGGEREQQREDPWKENQFKGQCPHSNEVRSSPTGFC